MTDATKYIAGIYLDRSTNIASASHNFANLRILVINSSTVSVSSCLGVIISDANLNLSVSGDWYRKPLLLESTCDITVFAIIAPPGHNTKTDN
jgi:hypothetical protein